ncbi:hypothetical protein [Flavobacterium chungnamense]|uniref:Uncharacterized protein n=1 Tax=Flavobacterium chungnamense TaxID=706182 RepID=A0ABP7V263_9FLAO
MKTKEKKEVKEMKFKMRFDAWKEIKIIIIDEEKFKESCEEFFEDEEREIDFYDLEDSYFEDCVEIEHGEIEWDDEDREEYEEIMGEYISQIM